MNNMKENRVIKSTRWNFDCIAHGRKLRRNRRRSGVALLVAITTLAMLTVIVSEVSYVSRMRFLTAYHQKDRVQAYWLAKSGTNIYALILAANKQLGKNSMIQQFGLGDSLWQMVPVINTGLMRMLFASQPGNDLSEEDVESFKQEGRVSEDVMEQSREGGIFNDRNFLDFNGDFSAEVQDTESKIDISQMANENGTLQESPTAQRLFALMGGEENDEWFMERNIDRWEVIGNLKDWVDVDNLRSGGLGGDEDGLYNRLDDPYLTKNAKFDTLEEIRLVAGWNGELFEKYKEQLTIWSNGKFNLNSFDDEMHKAMIRAAALTPPTDAMLDMCLNDTGDSSMGVLSMWDVTTFNNANQYATFILTNCGIELDKSKLTNITKSSQVFRVSSTGMVGDSSVTITSIFDYSRRSTGEVKYIRIE